MKLRPKPGLSAACTRAGSNPGAGIETRVRGDGWDPMGLLESTPLYKAKGCGIYFGTLGSNPSHKPKSNEA